jgi:hypothetical protein
MKAYTGSRVFQALRPGWASSPDPLGIPEEPPNDLYMRGNVPLETLPAPYYNWFLNSITNNDPRVADALSDIYGSFDYILTLAQRSYTGNANDLYQALYALWSADITSNNTGNIQPKLDALTSALATEVTNRTNGDNTLTTALNNEITRATAAESTLTTNLATEATTRATADTSLGSRATALEAVVPSQATSANQLADKQFVNSSITSMASRLLTFNSTGSPFATKAALLAATTFYYAGSTVTPSNNDYVVVQADETQSGGQVRYVYQGTTWAFAYVINAAPFTAAQSGAINSNITQALTTKLSALPDNTTLTNALNAKQNNIAGNGSSYVMLFPDANGGAPNYKALSDFALKAGSNAFTNTNSFSGATSFSQRPTIPSNSNGLTDSVPGDDNAPATERQVYNTVVGKLGGLYNGIRKSATWIIGTGDIPQTEVDKYVPSTSTANSTINSIMGSNILVIFREGTYQIAALNPGSYTGVTFRGMGGNNEATKFQPSSLNIFTFSNGSYSLEDICFNTILQTGDSVGVGLINLTGYGTFRFNRCYFYRSQSVAFSGGLLCGFSITGTPSHVIFNECTIYMNMNISGPEYIYSFLRLNNTDISVSIGGIYFWNCYCEMVQRGGYGVALVFLSGNGNVANANLQYTVFIQNCYITIQSQATLAYSLNVVRTVATNNTLYLVMTNNYIRIARSNVVAQGIISDGGTNTIPYLQFVNNNIRNSQVSPNTQQDLQGLSTGTRVGLIMGNVRQNPNGTGALVGALSNGITVVNNVG